MKTTLSRIAAAVGVLTLGLASKAGFAASVTYDFKTFYDTSTASLIDTKTLNYSVASLTLTDISGGVQVSVNQLASAFPAKTGGTYLDTLWLSGAKGTISSVSGTAVSSLFSGYNATSPYQLDAGATYPWKISFAGLLGGGIAEGGSSVFKITGTGVTVAALTKSTPMIDLTNVGAPYNTTLLGLGGGNVHFLGKVRVAGVPEPSTYALMGLGLVGMGLVARRRKAA